MSSLPGLSSPGKRLAELLQEKQEPFFLDIYILENGCSRKIVGSEPTNTCWPGGAWRRLRSLAGHQFGGPRSEQIVRFLISALHHKTPPETSRRNGGALCREERAGEIEVHADRERNNGWEGPDKRERLSPVSVLELCSDDITSHRDDCGVNEADEPPKFATYIPKLDFQSLDELRRSASSSEDLLEGSPRKAPSAISSGEGWMEMKRGRNPNNRRGQEILTSERLKRTTWSWCLTRGFQIARAAAERELVETYQFGPFVKEIGDEIGLALLDDLVKELLAHLTPSMNAHSCAHNSL